MSAAVSLASLRQLSRMLAVAALAGVVTVVPVACDDSGPMTGTVIDKKFDAADTDNVPICEATENSPCKLTFAQLPKGAHYELLIKDGERESWVPVPPEVYNRVYVGDPWPERRPSATTPTTTEAATTGISPGAP